MTANPVPSSVLHDCSVSSPLAAPMVLSERNHATVSGGTMNSRERPNQLATCPRCASRLLLQYELFAAPDVYCEICHWHQPL